MKPVVLQLIDSFNEGGSERQALQLTRLLCDSGRFQIRLASLSPEGSLRQEIGDLDLGEVPSFPLNNFYDRNAIIQLRRFVRFLKSEKVDVLHTHDFYTNVFGMTGGKLAGLSARIASMRETTGMRTKVQLSAQRFAYSMAHRVVANSDAVREALIEQGVPSEKITVIYNGIDPGRVSISENHDHANSLARVGLSPAVQEKNRIVTLVANMRLEVKDHPTFLRAAQKVREVIPDAVFLLAGEGELMPSIRAMAHELGLETATYFLGRCEALSSLLSLSDVCVLSSKSEGFSNSILEYMAAGKPVVATDVGGAREVIAEGVSGYLVPAEDADAMAQRIIQLLGSSDRESFGLAGRKIVEEKFSLKAQLVRTEELYDRQLGLKR